MGVGLHEATGLALAAGRLAAGLMAEEKGCEGAGGGPFTDAGRAGEDQTVGQAVGLVGAGEPGDGVGLAEDGLEGEQERVQGLGFRRGATADQMSLWTSLTGRSALMIL